MPWAPRGSTSAPRCNPSCCGIFGGDHRRTGPQFHTRTPEERRLVCSRHVTRSNSPLRTFRKRTSRRYFESLRCSSSHRRRRCCPSLRFPRKRERRRFPSFRQLRWNRHKAETTVHRVRRSECSRFHRRTRMRQRFPGYTPSRYLRCHPRRLRRRRCRPFHRLLSRRAERLSHQNKRGPVRRR